SDRPPHDERADERADKDSRVPDEHRPQGPLEDLSAVRPGEHLEPEEEERYSDDRQRDDSRWSDESNDRHPARAGPQGARGVETLVEIGVHGEPGSTVPR